MTRETGNIKSQGWKTLKSNVNEIYRIGTMVTYPYIKENTGGEQ